MELSKFGLLRLYLTGFWHVFLYTLLLAVLVLWSFQFCAILMGYAFDWSAIFSHLLLTFNFVAFYPGQTFWNYALRGSDDKVYAIIGSLDRCEMAPD